MVKLFCVIYVATVQLNYNFIFPHMTTCGYTQIFTCEIQGNLDLQEALRTTRPRIPQDMECDVEYHKT